MKKILIIEDDQIVANIYRNKLVVEGYRVEVAYDGESGLEMAKSFLPDGFILDLMLPKISGVDLMRKLRAEAHFEKTPMIVFSNTFLTNMVQEAWKAGATKCLSKASCTPRNVLDAIKSTVGTNGAPAASPASAAATPAAPPPQASQPAPAARPTSTAAPAPAPAPKVAQPTAVADTDVEFQADLRKQFSESLPASLASLRSFVQASVKADNEPDRLKQLHEFYRRVHALTGNAGIAGMVQIAQMSDALEALLKELHEKPKNITASALRTVANTVDFLGVLFDQANKPQKAIAPARILVVDDEAISRRAITYALEKAKLTSENVENPEVAFKMASDRQFDLIFLDVDMPGMNGYQLCTKIRALPTHKTTPVVFVTSLNDFEARASSMMSGGNDFIAKPFLFMELAVKAVHYILRGKLELKRKVVG